MECPAMESPLLEVRHKSQQSHDSGAYLDWSSEESVSPTHSGDSMFNVSDEFVTVVSVGSVADEPPTPAKQSVDPPDVPFVTVLAIGAPQEGDEKVEADNAEEVVVYRLPGERLGFGLKFEGGMKSAELVKRLFIQSCAEDSPACRARCSWGRLEEGDEVLDIDGVPVDSMTRIDCVRCLKESHVVIKLRVRHAAVRRKQELKATQSVPLTLDDNKHQEVLSPAKSFGDLPLVISAEMKKALPPPIPPRKQPRKPASSPSLVIPPSSFADAEASPRPAVRTSLQGDVQPRARQRVPPASPSPEIARHLAKRLAPPEAEVYLDLLALEETNRLSESDDTGSTLSTVVDRFSTTNSSFSDLRSSAPSTTPSTPTPGIDMARVLGPFEQLEREFDPEFLLSKLVLSNAEQSSEPLQPPLSFQDMPRRSANYDNVVRSEPPSPELPPKPAHVKQGSPPTGRFKSGKKRPPPPPPPRTDRPQCPQPPVSDKEAAPMVDVDLAPTEDICEDAPPPQHDVVERYPVCLPRGHDDEEGEPISLDYSVLDDITIHVPQLSASDLHDIPVVAVDDAVGEDTGTPCVETEEAESDEFHITAVTASGADVFFPYHWSVTSHLATIGEEDEAESLRSASGLVETSDSGAASRDAEEARREKPANQKDGGDFENVPFCERRQDLLQDPTTVPTPKQRVATTKDGGVHVKTPLPEISVEVEEVEVEEVEAERPPQEDIADEAVEGEGEMDVVATKPSFMLEQPSPMSDLSLSPPPSFSRLPPDGHEFPTCYQEPGSHFSVGEPALIELELKQDIEVFKDSASDMKPPVQFELEPVQDVKVNGEVKKEVEVKEPTPMKVDIKSTVSKPPRPEVELKPVEVPAPSAPPPPLPSSVPPSRPEVESEVKPRRLESRPGQELRQRPKSWRQDEKSEQSVRDKIAMFASQEDKVPAPINPARRLGNMYRSSDNIYVEEVKPHPRVMDKWSSTLPSKPMKQDFASYCNNEPRSLDAEQRAPVDITRPPIVSTLHSRSQSLVDVSRRPLRHSIGSDPSRSVADEMRRASLNALVEQRKRGMSKLRGLVIPEKPEIAPTSHCVFDLPEIKSRESILTTKPALVTNRDDPRLSSDRNWGVTYPTEKTTTNLTSPPWKSQAPPTNLPKYSPAFKRKSLAVLGAPSSSTFESKPPPLPPSKPPRNPNTLPARTSPNSYSSTPSFAYNEPPHSLDYKSSKVDRPPSDDSDNDSAVSSSRSSISHEFSPPQSPLPSHMLLPSSADRMPLRRTLSSETTSSTTSTLTSGSQASCSSNGGSSSDTGRRVLKAQSVEAINRKNVLSSARYSSGRDLKVGSPLIERKLHDEEDDDALSDLDGSEASKDSTYYGSYPEDNPVRVAYLDTVVVEDGYDEMSNGAEARELPIAAPRRSNVLSSEPAWQECEVPEDEPPLKAIVAKKHTNGDVSNGTNGHTEAPRRTESSTREDVKVPRTKDEVDVVSPPLPSRIPGAAGRNRRSVSVIDIRKAFEKAELALNGSRTRSNGIARNNHARVSSLDSTTSEDSCAVTPAQYGSVNNLQREQFGSITSLASSTSLISQQELQALIDEANQALEEQGPPNQEVQVVVLHRELSGGSVGITLAGGADYEAKEITVHKVLGGSAADRDGRIQKGDRILSINGKSMKGVTHRESLNILKAPRTEVILVISRCRADSVDSATNNNNSNTNNYNRPLRIPEQVPESPNAGTKVTARGPPVTVTLVKEGAGLGFSLEGGKDSPLGDKPLVIKKIFIGGSADKSHLIRAGDELLRVNEEDVAAMSRIEAWGLMKKLPDGPVMLTVRHQVENKLR